MHVDVLRLVYPGPDGNAIYARFFALHFTLSRAAFTYAIELQSNIFTFKFLATLVALHFTPVSESVSQ